MTQPVPELGTVEATGHMEAGVFHVSLTLPDSNALEVAPRVKIEAAVRADSFDVGEYVLAAFHETFDLIVERIHEEIEKQTQNIDDEEITQ